jgi:tetratricopeptide (TPR) repeat protein
MAEQYDQALADLTQAIEQASFAYASRGQVYQEAGDFPKALVDLDKAIEIDPDYNGPRSGERSSARPWPSREAHRQRAKPGHPARCL